MLISLIAAVARNGVIGHEGRMPWKLPNDLRFFKQVTMDKPVILGRKTWESFGSKPLPGRPHIVLTTNSDFTADGATIVHDLDSAIETGKRLAAQAGVEEVMIIGGAQIYAAALPLADRIYLTEIAATPPGDAHFPEFDRTAYLGEELILQMAEGPDRPAYRTTLFHKR
ncbi:dihydrofolate reductase [Niveispirillum sp.]|uniref:dihydrofolate reductase n=1 Tax=Niveispirillum sp. TaxID=1917217 RepID=UPI001B54F3EA|nr:dihydrofolate reductase [Niveispirillum sp.]MBP7340548.1 dihydrofolate reductase [Niveispirillum sp.]